MTSGTQSNSNSGNGHILVSQAAFRSASASFYRSNNGRNWTVPVYPRPTRVGPTAASERTVPKK